MVLFVTQTTAFKHSIWCLAPCVRLAITNKERGFGHLQNKECKESVPHFVSLFLLISGFPSEAIGRCHITRFFGCLGDKVITWTSHENIKTFLLKTG